MKSTVWIGILFLAAVVGYVVFSTFHQDRLRCEACVTFNGRRDCRTASAATQQDAIRAAVTTACAQLASGVTYSVRCENPPPDSVRWLQ